MATKYDEQIQTLPIYKKALEEGITIKLVRVEEDKITGDITEVVHEYFRGDECLCRNTTFIPDGKGRHGLEEILVAGLDTAHQMGEVDFSSLNETFQADADAEED